MDIDKPIHLKLKIRADSPNAPTGTEHEQSSKSLLDSRQTENAIARVGTSGQNQGHGTSLSNEKGLEKISEPNPSTAQQSSTGPEHEQSSKRLPPPRQTESAITLVGTSGQNQGHGTSPSNEKGLDKISESNSSKGQQSSSHSEFQEFRPIHRLLEDQLLAEEFVELRNPKAITPRLRHYMVARPPSNWMAVVERACHDIMIYVTGGTLKDSKGTGQVGLRGMIGLLFVECIFIILIAGLHALAWNFEFPTWTEKILWRLSCIGLAAFPAAVATISASTSIHKDLANILWNNHTTHFTMSQWFRRSLRYMHELAIIGTPGRLGGIMSRIMGRDRAMLGEGETTEPTGPKNLAQGNEKSANVNVEAGNSSQTVRKKSWIRVILLGAMIYCCLASLLGYVVCVLFLTFESYISLRRYHNQDIFLTSKWTLYWPHI